MTPTQKRKILVELIELKVWLGYDLTPYVGKNLNHFNWEYMEKYLEELRNENNDPSKQDKFRK